MKIKKSVFFLVVLLLLVMLTYFIFYNSNLGVENVINDRVETEIETVKTTDNPLSEQVEYPSPVQQLQQVVTYGLVNAEAPDLPLLEGELKQFSDQNIKEKYQLPEDLQQLKQQLSELKLVTEN